MIPYGQLLSYANMCWAFICAFTLFCALVCLLQFYKEHCKQKAGFYKIPELGGI